MVATGTELTPVEWIITNGGVAAVNVLIENTTVGTSEQLLWSNTLDASAKLKVGADGNTWDCYVSTDGGSTWTRNNTNVTGRPPRVQGGSTNAIRITGCSNGGSLSWTFYPRSI